MGRPVKVAYVADTTDLISSLGKAESAMDGAATTASTAGSKIESSFDTAGAAADGVASTSSQVAGGLGDLAGALEATGLVSEGTAASMETASAAIMGVTGVSDLANAAFEKFKVGTLASKTAQVAHTVATKAQTGAQRVLNAVMRANPIGLIITALTLLVGGLILAYNKSETFRDIVDGAFTKAKNVVIGVKDAVVTFAGTVADKAGAIGNRFGDIRDAAAGAVGAYRQDGGGILGRLWGMVDTIGGLGGRIAGKAAGMWDGMKDSFRGMLNGIIGWWNDLSFYIDLPDKLPGLPDAISFGTPNIPFLADGGIVNGPTLAVIGEAGPEAVIPLDRLGGMGGGLSHVKVTLTAQQVSQLTRGREIQMDLDAYRRAGGRVAAL